MSESPCILDKISSRWDSSMYEILLTASSKHSKQQIKGLSLYNTRWYTQDFEMLKAEVKTLWARPASGPSVTSPRSSGSTDLGSTSHMVPCNLERIFSRRLCARFVEDPSSFLHHTEYRNLHHSALGLPVRFVTNKLNQSSKMMSLLCLGGNLCSMKSREVNWAGRRYLS